MTATFSPRPTRFQFSFRNDTATVSWDFGVDHWEVEWEEASDQRPFTGNQNKLVTTKREFTLSGLVVARNYGFRVRPVNDVVGAGEWVTHLLHHRVPAAVAPVSQSFTESQAFEWPWEDASEAILVLNGGQGGSGGGGGGGASAGFNSGSHEPGSKFPFSGAEGGG
ncbi:MAG: fibronectin type III domain-containing protein, partial [Holophagales bacterium]|nr:fibronectin type III domain-containing protein [Holophagales bacterium]